MIQATGNGQSECYICKKQGKYCLTWTNFLYKTKYDDLTLYCFKHCKELEEIESKIEKIVEEVDNG